MLTRARWRRRSAVAVLLVSLIALAAPHEARAVCVGTPPSLISTLAFAEGTIVVNGVVTNSTTALALSAVFDDPDGTVPSTLTSVQVTDPNSVVTVLPYNFPDLRTSGLAAVSDYFKNTGSTTIPTGTYQFQATDVNGCITTVNNTLAAFPELGQVTITSPTVEQILTTTTPTFTWNAVPSAQSYRVRVQTVGTFATTGQERFVSQKMSGTSYTMPPGILTPGRRYGLRVEAFDTTPTGAGQFFNARSTGIQDFSVAGPAAAVSTNRGIYTAADTFTLNLRLRNRGTTVADTHLRLWLSPPGAQGTFTLFDSDLRLSANLDTGTILVISTPASGLPTGNWGVGVRLNDRQSGEVMAERVFGFSIGP